MKKEIMINLERLPISLALRVKRSYDDLLQKDLAHYLGIDGSYLSRIERGQVPLVSVQLKKKIQDYLSTEWQGENDNESAV